MTSATDRNMPAKKYSFLSVCSFRIYIFVCADWEQWLLLRRFGFNGSRSENESFVVFDVHRGNEITMSFYVNEMSIIRADSIVQPKLRNKYRNKDIIIGIPYFRWSIVTVLFPPALFSMPLAATALDVAIRWHGELASDIHGKIIQNGPRTKLTWMESVGNGVIQSEIFGWTKIEDKVTSSVWHSMCNFFARNQTKK